MIRKIFRYSDFKCWVTFFSFIILGLYLESITRFSSCGLIFLMLFGIGTLVSYGWYCLWATNHNAKAKEWAEKDDRVKVIKINSEKRY